MILFIKFLLGNSPLPPLDIYIFALKFSLKTITGTTDGTHIFTPACTVYKILLSQKLYVMPLYWSRLRMTLFWACVTCP